MTIRIRNDSTSAVVRAYALDSRNTIIWLELAPQHPKTIGAIWADLVVEQRPWFQLGDFDVVGTGRLRSQRRGRTGHHDRFLGKFLEGGEAMAYYDMDYALHRLRDAIDFAEIEHDFVPLRKWANEVEESCHGLEAIETRLNQPAGQDFLLTTLQSFATGLLSSKEASQRIRIWFNGGPIQDAELTQQYQFA